MRKLFGFLIGIGVIALIAGGVLIAVGYFNGENSAKYVTEMIELNDSFTDFNIDLKTSNIEFIKSDDGKNKIFFKEIENIRSTASVQNNTLVIKQTDSRPWYKKMFFFNYFQNTEIKVYLTETNYANMTCSSNTGNIKINYDFTFTALTAKNNTGSISIYCNVTGGINADNDTGSVNISDVTTKSINIEADTGSINLNNLNVTDDIRIDNETGSIKIENSKCANLYAKASTGSIKVTNSSMDSNMDLKTSTGSIKLDKVETNTAYLKSTTGSISGTFTSPKIFSAKSKTGSVNVPSSASGGLVVVETSTGSINLSIA